MERRDLLKMTGAGIGALSVSSLLATVAKAEADLQLDSTWDKTFPKSDKVDHAKVAFKNRYGISLAADLYQPKDASGKLAWRPREMRQRKVSTALKAYAALTTSADRGAVRDLSQIGE